MRVIDLTANFDMKTVDDLFFPQGSTGEVDRRVSEIMAAIRDRGDEALCQFSLELDGFELTPATMRVAVEEIRECARSADDELVEILRQAALNIRRFHERQLEESWEFYAGDGVHLGQRISPVGSVGLYRSRRYGRLPFLRPDECHPGSSCRSRPDSCGDTSFLVRGEPAGRGGSGFARAR